ncbi:hypothetical protein BJX61DRAFT_495340 [Aspergillus egyptiacus]|nr:hypothetical protein BJX61DRAFT_495340 [Aspergillus egyptiacus]
MPPLRTNGHGHDLDPARIASLMLSWHSLTLVSCTTLQTLWAGYGQICAVTARATTTAAAAHLNRLCGLDSTTPAAGTTYPLILKLISPPRNARAGADAGADEGHLRKMLSYEVEQYFYTEVVPQLGGDVAVAQCLASTRDMQGHQEGKDELEAAGVLATIMTDLRTKFPVAGGKRGALNAAQVYGALEWLARFHSRSWEFRPQRAGAGSLDLDLDRYVLPPLEESRRRQEKTTGVDMRGGNGLWLNGGYTYLATRRKEYVSLVEDSESEWCEALCSAPDGSSLSVAEKAAMFLTPRGRSVESYIHGDVKSENLFTNTAGDKVAFFDFQYVGLGFGVSDLAKLFTCSVPLEMLVGDEGEQGLSEELEMQDGERKLLGLYRERLLEGREEGFYTWDTFKRHWETALVDWLRFQASWGFWGNTEWLEARVRSILSDQGWREWLEGECSRSTL